MATIGVKLELEGAPQYKENMAAATNQTKLYQAQLKRLTAEMGSETNAFKKSLTESKALSQQLEAQKQQSKLLEEQIAKTTEKYGADSNQVIKLKTQYENLQAAIAQTTSALDKNGGVAGAIGAQFDAVASKIDSVSSKVGDLGGKMTAGLTAPIVATGAASLKAFTEVDDGLDTIIKKTGASGEALKEMEDAAKNIATSIPTSFDAAGSAIGEVNTRFGLTGKELEDLSAKFIKFADLNGSDVSTSIDNVQAAMAAFNIDADKAGDVLDILNKAGQDSGIGMDRLASSLLTNASALTEVGMDINTAAGFIANLEKNGIDSGTAMAGLKKAFQNAAKEGLSMSEAMAGLEDTLKAGQTDTADYSAAMELFGNKAGPALAKAIQEGRLSFDEASNSIKDFADSVNSTFEATQDPTDQFQTNMNKLKLVGTDLATTAMPMITKAMEKMNDVITKVSEAWNGLSEEQQENIIKIAGVTAIIGPALVAVSKVGSAISNVFTIGGNIARFLPTIIAAATKIGAVLSASVIPAIGAAAAALAPFLPVIIGAGAAIAGTIVVIKNWGAITDWISEKWAALTAFLSEKVSAISDFFNNHFGIVGQIIAFQIETIVTTITTTVEIIKTIFITLGEMLKALFEGDWSRIGEILSAAFEKIALIIAAARIKMINKIMEILNGIKLKFDQFKENALQWGKDLIQNFIDGILAKWEALKQTVANVAQTVKDFLGFSEPEKGPLKDFHTFGRDLVENYANSIKSASYLLTDAVEDIAQDVTILANPLDAELIYDAVRTGASDASLSVAIGDREFARGLRDMGVAFNG